MADRKQFGKKHNQGSGKKICIIVIAVLIVLAAAGFLALKLLKIKTTPQEAAEQYFSLLNKGSYEEMYGLLSEKSKSKISRADFVKRNKNIYEGIGAKNIKVSIKGEPVYKEGRTEAVLSYTTSMDTLADKLTFDNKVTTTKEKRDYRIDWDSTVIFPALKDGYKVQIDTKTAKRGSILDRNGQLLAGQGAVSEVGIVPGKLGEGKAEAVKNIAGILDMTEEEINQKLGASYVKDDSFVPLKEIAKGEADKENALLKIPGVMLNDKEERVYPLGAAAGQLTGYVQTVTAEDLKKLSNKGYNENSVIGKTGLERAFEDQLRPVDGYSLEIVDGNGKEIDTLALKPAQNGKDIKVTVDAGMQAKAYEQFGADPGTVTAMNPKTGEVLALVSTPSFDPNEFVMGMSDKKWKELDNDPNKPLINRFNTSWTPGSTFKAITAAIGVDSGKIKPDENLGYVGLKWQKDTSWGNYYVTTLTDYGPEVNLANALIYSDNIYFARSALNIGADIMSQKFQAMGFNEQMPFELNLSKSTYDDDGKIDSDIQLADTGYGQGQLLVNPLHMLSMYSMFVNGGSMINPTLLYKDQPQPKFWKEQVVSPQTAELVKNDLIQVIENPAGTGASAKIDGLTMLGKTGTAEIKQTQEDTNGQERGWFICETTDDIPKPVAVAGMVENVKNKGISHYVTNKVREIVKAYEQ